MAEEFWADSVRFNHRSSGARRKGNIDGFLDCLHCSQENGRKVILAAAQNRTATATAISYISMCNSQALLSILLSVPAFAAIYRMGFSKRTT